MKTTTPAAAPVRPDIRCQVFRARHGMVLSFLRYILYHTRSLVAAVTTCAYTDRMRLVSHVGLTGSSCFRGINGVPSSKSTGYLKTLSLHPSHH